MYKQIDFVPEGWYEKNRITYISITENVAILKIEQRSGDLFGFITYELAVHNTRLPISETIFQTFLFRKEYEPKYCIETKYLDDQYNTYYVYDTGITGVFLTKGT